jgi:Flp pilus assembly protein CpaB
MYTASIVALVIPPGAGGLILPHGRVDVLPPRHEQHSEPEQTAMLTSARRAGTPSLVFFRAADADAAENALQQPRPGVSVSVIRHGRVSQPTAQK